MDLCANTKNVIVTMEHTTKFNEPKIVERCDFPLTAVNCIDKIVTDVGVFELGNNSIILKECAAGWDCLSILNITGVKVKYDK